MTDLIPGPGHNLPPEETPFEMSKREINDLYLESKHWLDGEPVLNQVHADSIAKLLGMLRDAVFTANQRRIKENEPFDKGKAEVQARYGPLIANTKAVTGKAQLAINGCKLALVPFLTKQKTEKDEAARVAREEAQAKKAAATEAMKDSAGDLEKREAAETQLQEAAWAERHAKAAERDTAKAKGDVGRSAGLRSYNVAEITDLDAFAKHVWLTYQPALIEFLTSYAQRLINEGVRNLPGVTIRKEDRVV